MLQEDSTVNSAMTLLMEAYRKPLYWHIRRMLGSHDDAADILQDTFIKAYLHREALTQVKHLDAWLYKVATNASLSLLSKRSAENSIQDLLEENDGTTALCHDPELDSEKLANAFQTAVNSLPEKQKTVFLLRYYEAFPYRKISEITGSSIVSLKANYHYAEKKIKQYILSL